MQQGTFFIHLRIHPNPDVISPNGGATIAYEIDGQFVRYAFAKCKRTDLFNKKLGRDKAAGRLKSDRYVNRLAIPNYSPDNPPKHSVIIPLLINLYYDTVRPYWSRVHETMY